MLAALALPLLSLGAQDMSLEMGASGGGGFTFAFGGYMDAVRADLVSRGSMSGGDASVIPEASPSWTGGVYVTVRLVEWFKLGMSPHMGYLGGSLLALTDTGKTWERFSFSCSSVLLPITARFCFDPGPGFQLEAYLGPEIAVQTGNLVILETLAQSSYRREIEPRVTEFPWLAATAGLEGRLKTAIGWLTLGLGYEMAILPVSGDRILRTGTAPGFLGAPVYPCALNLYVGWGWSLPLGASSGKGKQGESQS
jgi:hypothetical protein